MVGGAAKGIASRLERHGYELVAKPEGFLIEGDAGLLRPVNGTAHGPGEPTWCTARWS